MYRPSRFQVELGFVATSERLFIRICHSTTNLCLKFFSFITTKKKRVKKGENFENNGGIEDECFRSSYGCYVGNGS